MNKVGGKAGVDPGFPVGGGADPPGGRTTYDFVKFSQKLHEIEKILGRGGGMCQGRRPWIRHWKVQNDHHLSIEPCINFTQ